MTAIAGFAVLAIAGLPLLDDIGLISVRRCCATSGWSPSPTSPSPWRV